MHAIEKLRAVSLFSHLSDTELAELHATTTLCRFAPGQVIIREGEPGESFHIIAEGEVAFVTVDAGGSEIVLDTASEGGWFGELSLLTGEPRSARVRAQTAVTTLSVQREPLRQFLTRHPHVALEILAVIGRRLARADDLLRKTAARNVNDIAQEQATAWQRTADIIAAVSASAPFVLLHLLWFGCWIGWNLYHGEAAFDPFPFGLLTMIVSLEAIFLAIFVLVSQNRSGQKDRIAADVDHQVNLKAEQQTGLILARLDDLQRGMAHMHGEHLDLMREIDQKVRPPQPPPAQ